MFIFWILLEYQARVDEAEMDRKDWRCFLRKAAANAAYSKPKDLDPNFQLRNGGVLTDVESSSMSVR